MKRTFRTVITTATLSACLIAGTQVAGAQAAENRNYILATASTGGTYYPVGVALATLSKVKLEPAHQFSLSAISSAGSGENVKLMNENEAQFAILQGLYGAWAWNGEGQFANSGRQEKLRSVTMLWQNVEHFVVRSDLAKTGTVADLSNLKGHKFSIGSKNSGTEGSGRQIMKGLGVNPDSFNLAYLGYGASADAMQNGTVDGMNTPAGVPVSAVTRAFASLGKDITILSFTDAQVKEANQNYELWTPYTIPARTYPGQEKDVQTIAQPNFLAVRDDISEQDVYLLTKTIYENLPFLNSIHAATKAMAIEKAIAGLPVPLHPGAVKYYREVGITIPERLIAK
ncbi:C4-dicarboxylate ABC transporter substrate-binding protein [Photobacterium galatheae]|uniref:C4-dicarboxylate ABC transporter substrate-binding protein n=1 Tax=Photobacterium galatheae TaxID=1654360 RepID=A0A066RQU7_9GAMM|nr:C4-dicarboxylate ABC transporter substrate-binding protein [Photobacterium galatheae]